jgi:hypothetical protein
LAYLTYSIFRLEAFCNGVGQGTNRWLSYSNADGSASAERSWLVPKTATYGYLYAYVVSNTFNNQCTLNLVANGSSNLLSITIDAAATGAFTANGSVSLTAASDRLGLRLDQTSPSSGTIVLTALAEVY